MDEYYFIAPEDVLMPRGNRAFGAAGEHGEIDALPWPSVFAGALRSALLGADPQALADFSAGKRPKGAHGAVLGTPDEPGTFRLSWVSFARAADRAIEPIVPLPADLLAMKSNGGSRCSLAALNPMPLPAGVRAGTELPLVAGLRTAKADKPVSGWLLDAAGLRAYLAGRMPEETVTARELFETELRLGIALDGAARTAAEGALYTTEAVRFARRGELWCGEQAEGHRAASGKAPSAFDAGYLVGVRGAQGLLPERGILRLGGDARAARYRRVVVDLPAAPLERIAAERRFRVILLTPTLFEAGWVPDRVRRNASHYRLEGDGFAARLACAALPRFAVVSGWDLARMRPKPAQRTVPGGAVYWFDEFEGDVRKLAEWVDGGVWGENADAWRRAEGFNLAMLGAWR